MKESDESEQSNGDEDEAEEKKEEEKNGKQVRYFWSIYISAAPSGKDSNRGREGHSGDSNS